MSFLSLVLATAALAAAAAAPLSIDLTVYPRATADRDGNVIVRGLLTCSIETTVSLDVHVVEPLNRSGVAGGQSSIDVPCDAAPTPWTIVVEPDTERAFHPGSATVAVSAVGFDPENGIFAGVESFGFLRLTRSLR